MFAHQRGVGFGGSANSRVEFSEGTVTKYYLRGGHPMDPASRVKREVMILKSGVLGDLAPKLLDFSTREGWIKMEDVESSGFFPVGKLNYFKASQAMRDAAAAISRLRINHGDLEDRHVFVNPHGEFKIIDWETWSPMKGETEFTVGVRKPTRKQAEKVIKKLDGNIEAALVELWEFQQLRREVEHEIALRFPEKPEKGTKEHNAWRGLRSSLGHRSSWEDAARSRLLRAIRVSAPYREALC